VGHAHCEEHFQKIGHAVMLNIKVRELKGIEAESVTQLSIGKPNGFQGQRELATEASLYCLICKCTVKQAPVALAYLSNNSIGAGADPVLSKHILRLPEAGDRRVGAGDSPLRTLREFAAAAAGAPRPEQRFVFLAADWHYYLREHQLPRVQALDELVILPDLREHWLRAEEL